MGGDGHIVGVETYLRFVGRRAHEMGISKSERRGAPSTATAAGAGGRAVLHVRIVNDPEGVDRQEADCRAYAESQGLTVAEVFRENDTSAFKQGTVVLPSGEKVRGLGESWRLIDSAGPREYRNSC
jgi:1,6-anhydro-N-acetylmuramate kinase